MQCSPIDTDVDRRALVSRSKETFSKLLSPTNGVQIVQVVQDDMVQPQASIGICVCPIGILKSSLHVGDGAIFASKLDACILEVLHAIVDVHRWYDEWSVSDLHSFGALVGEELRCKCCDG